jgi:hypothetical protein
MELKLQRLPDRKPVKIGITVSAELARKLQAYADLYRQSYRDEEEVAELIPYMLESFLESDKNFTKALRTGGTAAASQDT